MRPEHLAPALPPAPSTTPQAQGKLASGRVKQQDVFLASFFTSAGSVARKPFKQLQELATSLTTSLTTLLICKRLLGNRRQDPVCLFSFKSVPKALTFTASGKTFPPEPSSPSTDRWIPPHPR